LTGLSGLTPEELRRLGGILPSCSEPLACSAHGAPWPCAICALDNANAVACITCGHHFAQGLVSADGRPCESESVFVKTGKVAFEAEAVAALAAREKALEKEAETKRAKATKKAREERDNKARKKAEKKARDDAKRREREEADRLARAEAEVRAKEDLEKHLKERKDGRAPADSSDDTRPPEAPEPVKRGRWNPLLASLSVNASWFVFGAGVFVVASANFGGWRFTPGDVAAFGAFLGSAVIMVWRATSTLRAVDGSAVDFRIFAPVVWGAASLAWPIVGALQACAIARNAEFTGAFLGYLLVKLGVLWLCVHIHRSVGIGFSFKAPGPDGHQKLFAGWRRILGWLLLGLTFVIAAGVVAGPAPIRDCASLASGSSLGGSAPAQQQPTDAAQGREVAEPKVAPAAQDGAKAVPGAAASRDTVITALGEITSAINALPELRPDMLPADGPIAAREAVAAITDLPKPARGDRRAARALLGEALPLLQQGRAADAADLLLRAHEADPLDVQVVNDLAYAELKAGRLPAAWEHVVRALELAPTRANAWANFAELVATARPNDPDSVEAAGRLFVVAWWFSRDRQRTAVYFQERASSGDTLPPVSAAYRLALARILPDPNPAQPQ